MKLKAISKTVDAYPDLTPVERYKLLLQERTSYSKETIEAFFKTFNTNKNNKNESASKML